MIEHCARKEHDFRWNAGNNYCFGKSSNFGNNNNNSNGYFKCYFTGEHIALSLKNNNDVNIEVGKTNILTALCMVQVNT